MIASLPEMAPVAFPRENLNEQFLEYGINDVGSSHPLLEIIMTEFVPSLRLPWLDLDAQFQDLMG